MTRRIDSSQRVALITGAARGIGRATAEAFIAAGWRTIGVDLDPCHDVDRSERVDLANTEDISALAKRVAKDNGRLDALVNNAALQVCSSLAETTLEDWERVLAVNLRAPFWLMHEFVGLLEASHGAIVNVSSVHAIATSTSIFAYGTTKGALTSLTRAAALEFAPRGIRVNAVLPGAVETPMLREGLERNKLDPTDLRSPMASFGAKHPLGRIAQPEEIAQAILYLADNNRSSYVTGQCHVVDGGVTIRLSTETA